jgi:hypothetical protein
MPRREPKISYRLVCGNSPTPLDRRTYATEQEARSSLDALFDKSPASADGLEVERVEQYPRGTSHRLKRAGEWHAADLVLAGKSIDEIRAQEAEWEAERTHPGPRKFVATFGGSYYHPDTGQNLRFARLPFEAATQDDAFDLLWVAFGDNGWYHAHLVDKQIEADLWQTPYFRIGWPRQTSHPGEAVTLRVRITAAQAGRSELWVAGRCLLHRPAPDCTVQVGAGVMPEDGSLWQSPWSNHQGAGVNGEGMVLFVKYVRRAEAERAAAADPENVSVVPGSESLGTFRCKPKVLADELDGPLAPRKNRIVVSGVFTLDALEAIGAADPSFSPVTRAAIRAWEALAEEDQEKVHGVEVEENVIRGLYFEHPRRG